MEKRVRKSTMVELVNELEAIRPRTKFIENMIYEARAGEFHDFKNQKYTCGKVALVCFLEVAGQKELAQRVMQGEFDEEADEADKIELRKGLPQQLWPSFGLQ